MTNCIRFIFFCLFSIVSHQEILAQSDSLLMPMLNFYEQEKKIQEKYLSNLKDFIRQSKAQILPDSIYQVLFEAMPKQPAGSSGLPYQNFQMPVLPRKREK